MSSAVMNAVVESAEQRAALRSARVRAVLFLLFTLAAFGAASAAGAKEAIFSFWIDKIGEIGRAHV